MQFQTFYNAISHEVGDIINVQHQDLANALVSAATVATQKWAIVEFDIAMHPALINITAIELL